MSQYIFGDIDVPALDEDQSTVAAYDMSRRLELNRNNEIVRVLDGFVGHHVDVLRRELASQEQVRRAQEEVKRLSREASKIAELINEDFRDFSDRITKVRARSGSGPDFGVGILSVSDEPNFLIQGTAIAATETASGGGSGRGDGEGGMGGMLPDRGPVLAEDEKGKSRGDNKGSNGAGKRESAGFRVDFRAMGCEGARAVYQRQDRTIFLNLEHPQIAAAKGGSSVDDPTFRRLAYEVAFSEYAIALASEIAEKDGYPEPSDAIYEIRDTLNRMARRAAILYENR